MFKRLTILLALTLNLFACASDVQVDEGQTCDVDDDCEPGEVCHLVETFVAIGLCVPAEPSQTQDPAPQACLEEVCDGLDNDCDGLVDEGVENTCGGCGPTPEEICNGQDDDCDGDIDNGVLNACGECGPVPIETCNGVDDDCDGSTDEGELCGQGQVCRSGRCEGVCQPRQEVCNGVDDDCDGQIDEGALNACGECGPAPREVCDGQDNDCDGQIDEGAEDCGLEVISSVFEVRNGETRRIVLSTEGVHSNLVPLCMIDSYRPGTDDDMSYECTTERSGRDVTFTIRVWDGGGSVKGTAILLGHGEDIGHASRAFSVANDQVDEFEVPSVVGRALGSRRWTFPEVRTHNACGDDDMAWVAGWEWDGVSPIYTARHNLGGCAVAGRAHLFGTSPRYRFVSEGLAVNSETSKRVSLSFDPTKQVVPFVALASHQTCGDDDMNIESSWQREGDTYHFDVRVFGGGCGATALAYLLEF